MGQVPNTPKMASQKDYLWWGPQFRSLSWFIAGKFYGLWIFTDVYDRYSNDIAIVNAVHKPSYKPTYHLFWFAMGGRFLALRCAQENGANGQRLERAQPQGRPCGDSCGDSGAYGIGHCGGLTYPLVMSSYSYWKLLAAIYSGFPQWKWRFSIVMLVYQSVV